MIRFACPSCQSTFSVPDEKAGKQGRCPKCQAQFMIPDPGVGAEPAPVPSAPTPPAPALASSAPPPADEVEVAPCPGCQSRLTVAVADLGAEIECPHCKTVYVAARAGSPPPVSRRAMTEPGGGRRDRPDDAPVSRRPRDDRDEVEPRSRARDDEDDEDDRRPRRRSRRGGRSSGGTVRLNRLGVLSVGRVMGAVYALIGLIVGIPYGLLMLLGAATSSSAKDGGGAAGVLGLMGVCVVVLMPAFYGIGGFIGGVIMAALYNLVAGKLGGIEMDLD